MARLAASHRAKTGYGTIAAIGGNNDRGQRHVAFLGSVLAGTPKVAQHRPTRADCEQDNDDQGGELRHAVAAYSPKQDRRQLR